MQVIFLDVDGVLNSESWYRRRAGLSDDDAVPVPLVLPVRTRSRDDEIDPDAVQRLNRLTDLTGAALVLSSTWRMAGTDWLTLFLHRHGVRGNIVGATPVLPGPRGDEIEAWLSGHPEVTGFVILDDGADMDRLLLERLVRISFRTGLTDGDCERAAALLA